MGISKWRRVADPVARISRAEFRDRLRQELGKRQDTLLEKYSIKGMAGKFILKEAARSSTARSWASPRPGNTGSPSACLTIWNASCWSRGVRNGGYSAWKGFSDSLPSTARRREATEIASWACSIWRYGCA